MCHESSSNTYVIMYFCHPLQELKDISTLVRKHWRCGYVECSAKYVPVRCLALGPFPHNWKIIIAPVSDSITAWATYFASWWAAHRLVAASGVVRAATAAVITARCTTGLEDHNRQRDWGLPATQSQIEGKGNVQFFEQRFGAKSHLDGCSAASGK